MLRATGKGFVSHGRTFPYSSDLRIAYLCCWNVSLRKATQDGLGLCHRRGSILCLGIALCPYEWYGKFHPSRRCNVWSTSHGGSVGGGLRFFDSLGLCRFRHDLDQSASFDKLRLFYVLWSGDWCGDYRKAACFGCGPDVSGRQKP